MNTEIKIFNIAKTQVDKEEVRRWLDFLNVSDEWDFPPEEVVSNPALLIALAGKRCYMSFEEGLNPNVTKIRSNYIEYFDNILKSGHGCYDDETEVLTERGWINWTEVLDDDKFCTVVDDKVAYIQANKIIRSEYSGKMYRVKSQYVDLLVTPNHNMYVCKTQTKAGRTRENFNLMKAEDLGHVAHCYLKCLPYEPNLTAKYNEIAPYSLLGFAIGDGSIKSKRKLEFHLHRERKIFWLRNICRNLGWELKQNKDKYIVTLPDEYVDLFHQIYNEDKDKVIPQQLLIENKPEVIMGLFEGMIESDGSRGKTDISYHTVSLTLAGQFQHLCLLMGLSCNINKPHMPEFGNRLVQNLCVGRRNNKPEVNKYKDHVGKTYWVEGFEGTVYCAVLPDTTNHLLYVRRNGKPVWCGNSVLEHAVFTFAMEGVSRVFTAEMNRHRAGWAISEGSLRFIRFDKDIKWWLPTSLTVQENDPEEIKQRKLDSQTIFNRAFKHQEECYGELLKVWDMETTDKNFHYKKTVTSCLRRIVGMGVATGGVWTGNVRALRHVMAMRASPAAEEEILYVFSQIAKKMKEEEPLLFGDFVEENGFWKPKYIKV